MANTKKLTSPRVDRNEGQRYPGSVANVKTKVLFPAWIMTSSAITAATATHERATLFTSSVHWMQPLLLAVL